MSLYLSADDLRRYERASRAMLAPLAAKDVDAWRRDVNEAVRDLVGGDKSIFLLPQGERLFFSEEEPDLADSVERFVTAHTSEGLRLSDPVVDLWQRLRWKTSMESFSWATNAEMINRFGYRMADSEMVSDVLERRGVRNFVGLYPSVAHGDVLVWVLFERSRQARFGDDTLALLRTLLPSLKAGLDTLVRFDAHRQSLDEIADAVIVFGCDRRELHRNASFIRLCEADPERDKILAEVVSVAASLHLLVLPGRSPSPASAARKVTTRKASYDLKGTLLPPGSFGPDPSVMIMVSRNGAELPSAEALRERFGLTRREAEVALLLAVGCSNSEIAQRLFVSPHTARRHTANIFEKLGVNTRKGLAVHFLGS